MLEEHHIKNIYVIETLQIESGGLPPEKICLCNKIDQLTN